MHHCDAGRCSHSSDEHEQLNPSDVLACQIVPPWSAPIGPLVKIGVLDKPRLLRLMSCSNCVAIPIKCIPGPPYSPVEAIGIGHVRNIRTDQPRSMEKMALREPEQLGSRPFINSDGNLRPQSLEANAECVHKTFIAVDSCLSYRPLL